MGKRDIKCSVCKHNKWSEYFQVWKCEHPDCNECPIVFGQSRQGRVHFLEVVVFSERYILDNHLNNNNWLRQHGFPMIRKGHPLYMECKRCKGRAASKIIISDPKKD